MAIDKNLEDLDKFVTEKSRKAKQIIKKAANDAEPIIEKTREEIRRISEDAETKVKEFYRSNVKRKK